MKSLAKLTLAAALLGAPMAANALAQIFVGAEGSYTDTTLRSGSFGKHSDKIAGYGFRGGVYLGDSKIYLGYYYEPKADIKVAAADYKWDAKKVVLGWDWGVVGAAGFKLIVGAHLGHASTKESRGGDSISYDGFLAGIKAGLKYEFMHFNEVELGVKREWGWYGSVPKLSGAELSNAGNTRQESTAVYLSYVFKFGI